MDLADTHLNREDGSKDRHSPKEAGNRDHRPCSREGGSKDLHSSREVGNKDHRRRSRVDGSRDRLRGRRREGILARDIRDREAGIRGKDIVGGIRG